MAKGKHAQALFEVIHTAKHPPQGLPAAKLASPRSWWKGKNKAEIEDPPMLADRPSRLALMSALLSPRRAQKLLTEKTVPERPWSPPSAAAPEPTFAPPPLASPVIESHAMEAPEPQPLLERFVNAESVSFEPPPRELHPPMRLAREPEAHKAVAIESPGEISFHLSYGGAIAAGIIILLVVAIAYLVGTRASEFGLGDSGAAGDSQASAVPALAHPSGSTVSQSTQNAGMLAAVTTAPANDTTAAPPPPSAAPVAHTTHQLISPPAPVQPRPESIRREIGKTYVIVQSYPEADLAFQARDFLAHNNIQATVIRGLPRWAFRSWYSVVTLRPFDHPYNNPKLDAYIDQLTALGEEFAGRTDFNKFEPHPYTWHPDADATTPEMPH